MTQTGPLTLTCVCGAICIEVDVVPESLFECNCTYCSKKGTLWGYYPPSQVRFVRSGSDVLWQPKVNQHHFCATCGTTTHTVTPNWQREWQGPDAEEMQVALNMRLADEIDLSALPIEQIDGRKGWG